MRFVTPSMIAEEEMVDLSTVVRLFLKHSNQSFRRPYIYLLMLSAVPLGFVVTDVLKAFSPDAGEFAPMLGRLLLGIVGALIIFFSVEEYVVSDLRGENSGEEEL